MQKTEFWTCHCKYLCSCKGAIMLRIASKNLCDCIINFQKDDPLPKTNYQYEKRQKELEKKKKKAEKMRLKEEKKKIKPEENPSLSSEK
jgi:hypothetical protein